MSVITLVSPGSTRVCDTLVDVLRQHAEERPHQRAFCLLREGDQESALTYAEVDQRARAVATSLIERGLEGERVVLAYPFGLGFITGFFGCLYAGCTAVPAHPPQRRTMDRFLAIFDDCGARLALSTAREITQYRGLTEGALHSADRCQPIDWLATDEIPAVAGDRWEMPPIASGTLAMLQYTSGSTSQPKGVMLSHANLMHNCRSIRGAFGVKQEVSVSWLPMYHDMGLVGGLLEPVFAGVTAMLLAPGKFLQDPLTWLAMISKYRATISGGPNFAYDYCVRRITDKQRATLDLSSWKVAFVGAEPIQPDTLERFAAAFMSCGFNPTAFYPCYGMAEATLMISGATRGTGATTRSFLYSALAANRVESVSADGLNARRLVSCGTPVGDLRVLIVDPHTREEVIPNHVGEIWVSGRSVGQGYWGKPEQTRLSLCACLRGTRVGPFLRTGDLGFQFEGELYVTGRQNDLINVRGLNHHPQDLEATARASHPLLEAGIGAAFSVSDAGRSHLVLIAEVTRHVEADFTPVLSAIREAIVAKHGLTLDAIILVRCGTLPKTSSGKVQRRDCRATYLAGELTTVAEYRRTDGAIAAIAHRLDPPAGAPTLSPRSHESETFVFAVICQHAIALGGASLSNVTADTSLTALGLDSLQRVALTVRLETAFACRLPDAEFNAAQTLGDLARAVRNHLTGHVRHDAISSRIPAPHFTFAQFPEYIELKRYERMLIAVCGNNPYCRVAQPTMSSGHVANAGQDEVVDFCNYDYIGMAHDVDVVAAAKAALDHYGTGAGASRLVSGEKQVHRDLEQALAQFLGTPAAIAFVSGYATNVTTIGHLIGPEDLIVHDVLAHNSIMQGARLSGATRRGFAHNDSSELDVLLTQVRHRYRRVLIAIEGVYSMDGDSPDLVRFIELKKKHKALMLVDEAHSLGTTGPTGRGIGEQSGIARSDVDLWMGTLSKALASCGGYIAGSSEIVEYLRYTAPGFVYSVGMPPSNAAAALAALSVLRSQPHRVARLRELSIMFLRLAQEQGLDTGSASGTPVVPIIVGNSVKSLRLARALFDRGILVHPILPPAVPEHSARLRFFITTTHSDDQIRRTVSAISDIFKTL